MPWVLALSESESKRVIIVDTLMKIASDDASYENEVHVIPCTEEENGMCVFGRHDVTLTKVLLPSIGQAKDPRQIYGHAQ